MSALGAVGLMLLLAQPAMLLQPCAISRTWQRPLSSALSTAHHHLAVTVRPAITAVMQAEAEGAMDAEYAAEVTSAEPVSKAKAEPETEPETDPVAIEKQELKHQIADLERQLKSARGGLIEAQDSLKDAGEAGYMLLAADFERFRLRAKDEMGVQSGIGKLNTARQLLPFIETFSSLQGAEAESTEAAAIHSYYGGIYKQLMQLLEQWEVHCALPHTAAHHRKLHPQLLHLICRNRPARCGSVPTCRLALVRSLHSTRQWVRCMILDCTRRRQRSKESRRPAPYLSRLRVDG